MRLRLVRGAGREKAYTHRDVEYVGVSDDVVNGRVLRNANLQRQNT
jgi:hypothetical protein